MQSHLDLRDLLPGCWPLAVRLPAYSDDVVHPFRAKPSTRFRAKLSTGSGPSCPGLSGDREGVAVGDRGTV